MAEHFLIMLGLDNSNVPEKKEELLVVSPIGWGGEGRILSLAIRAL